MPTRKIETRLRTAVPLEFTGKWVAWSSDHSHIVADADSLQKLWQTIREKKIDDPVIEKVPRATSLFRRPIESR
jgi:hypothetical protein